MNRITLNIVNDQTFVRSVTILTREGKILILPDHERIYGTGKLVEALCETKVVDYNIDGVFSFADNSLFFVPLLD